VRIAAKNHANGMHNPFVRIRRDLGFDFCNPVSDRNPRVAGPFRRTDCSRVSDGVAAIVRAEAEVAAHLARAIGFRARVQANDVFPPSLRDPLAFDGACLAWARALVEGPIASRLPMPWGQQSRRSAMRSFASVPWPR